MTATPPWNDPDREWNAETWGRPVSGILFTQFLLPYGRRRPTWIDRSPEIEAKARELVAAGVHFDIEILTTADVSLTAELGDEVLAHEICRNGPAIPVAVDLLVTKAHRRLP